MKKYFQISFCLFIISFWIFRPESINNSQPIYRADIGDIEHNSDAYTDYDNLAVLATPYDVSNLFWFKTFYLTNGHNTIFCISMDNLPAEGLKGQYIVRLKRPLIINGVPLILYLKLLKKPDLNNNLTNRENINFYMSD